VDVTSIVYYVEAGKSAKNQNRPKLQELKRDIQAGKIKQVIVWKLDRITRSLLDFAELWALFRKHGVEISSVNEDFDTAGSMGRAMLHIIMVFAQLERELISERTTFVMKDRIERGLSNGGIRWGYQHDKAQNGKLVPDPYWAPIIREHFFDAFERLGSAGAVQRHLASVGIIVPKRQSPDGKIRGGNAFTKQQVTRVLTSDVYLGILSWGKFRKEGCHDPLVSKEQFDRVQKVLNHNRKTMRSRDPMGQYPFLLKGILRCKCGRMMTSYFSTGHSGTMHPY
jgi:site-specific DNA recombinase